MKTSQDKIDMGHSAFYQEHVNTVATMKDLNAAKKFAHEIVDASTANKTNKIKLKTMIERSRSIANLAFGIQNHILAHPSEGLSTIK